MNKRKVALDLDEEQFVEMYSMSLSFLMTNKDPECGLAKLMQQIHDQCQPMATGVERDAVKTMCDRMKELMGQDSPDVFLVKAGMNGIVEDLMKE